VDIAPTVLSLISAAELPEFDGKSFSPTFARSDAPTPRPTQYWETLGHRAIWNDGWMAVTEHTAGASFEEDTWRVYDTRGDFAQAHDLSTVRPDKAAELAGLWWNEARANGVLPLDDRSLVDLINLKTPYGMYNTRRLVLRPGQSAVPCATRVTGSNRSMQVTAHLREHGPGHQGVLLSSGSSVGGYSLFLKAGRLHFEHLCLGDRILCIAEVATPMGNGRVGFRLLHGAGRSACIELLHGDEVVARTGIPQTSGHLSFFGLAVCSDPISQVSQAYAGPFAYPHDALEMVVIDFLDAQSASATAPILMATE
jgi:hypothetical protein